MAGKNPMGRSRKPGSAYITTTDPRTGWTWEVLKAWQADGSKPYARVFCNVHGFETEMGDVYVADIGRVIVDFDRSVFPSEDAARAALFGTGTPSADLGFLETGPGKPMTEYDPGPEPGKVYALTGDGPSIANGSTWAESEVVR